jgi:hypothetical protein
MAKSPFPGMDPFLERHWKDVHVSLIAFSRGQLNRQLAPPLRARAEERVYIETDDEPVARSPDVFVVEQAGPPTGGAAVAPAAGGTATVQPVIIHLASEPTVERYLEIVDAEAGDKVITVIEFLSPTNKRSGEGQDAYIAKRREYLRTSVNLVEVDLTRSGSREGVLPVRRLPRNCRGATYLACIRRACRRSEIEAYPIPLPARLPVIPIPLRDGEGEARLDLQALIDLAYEEGRHEMMDYSQPLQPPLAGDEAVFGEQMLRIAGKS